MKLFFLSIFLTSRALKLEKGFCDRAGKHARKVLQGSTSDTDLFEMAKRTGDGQSWYTSHATNGVVCFDNWGFYEKEDELPPVHQSETGSCPTPVHDKNGQRMYKYMVTNGLEENALQGKHVLEIGSGRGKGAAYIAQEFNPKSIIGVDLNEERVALASNSFRETANLKYRVGNALNLAFKNSTVDFVLNVESSFHYPNFTKFISEVFRVLAPGGRFLWVAPMLNRGESFSSKLEVFKRAGFHVSFRKDIVQAVVNSRRNVLKESDNKEFQILCDSLESDVSEDALWSWAALPGSIAFDALESGEVQYIRFIAQKPVE